MSGPIRILQVVTHMNRGGLETMLMNYYRQIDRNRVQFDFLVHRMERADYDDEIKSLGGVIYRLPRLIPWSGTYLRALDMFFAAHPEYKIVHVHQDCLSGVILRAAQKNGMNVRIAHSHSSSQDRDLKYPIKLFYRRQIPKYATDLFACGQAAGEWMFCGAPFTVLNNAVNAIAYQYNAEVRQSIRKELGIAENTFAVGHVGRFSYPKNHTYLLDIFAELHRRQPNSKLLLVGDGELRESIERKITDLGLSDDVILTGVRSDVAALLQAMDVFVFPSLYEGLPVTMVEAQAAGLPCFISDKVPSECKMTEKIWQIALSDTPARWADRILAADMTRTDTYTEIVAAGFDIAENAKWLEAYYEEAYRFA